MKRKVESEMYKVRCEMNKIVIRVSVDPLVRKEKKDKYLTDNR